MSMGGRHERIRKVNALNGQWRRIGTVWTREGYLITELEPGVYQAQYLGEGLDLGTHDHWSKARGACQQHVRLSGKNQGV